ncbi:hypothetical protein JEQ12_013223 [Ovis aries]|uniref:Ig-like domain-containing protein n=1 Tax=Ovis aries TaxID=9940 RepID=A0A836CSZ3_SHEEP|nr:hypothetical protein JEQ12_013223 [Ovis aries]
MSERKEGRGKGKGGKKDRGSGKKPAPAAGGQSPALPPRLKEMKSQESVAGSKLVLRCETSSEYSSLKFKWFKNGSELSRKNKPQNIKIQKRPGKSELRISKASLADSGEYMCKVISKLGNDSASANITIVESNEITTDMPASTETAYVSSVFRDAFSNCLRRDTQLFGTFIPKLLSSHIKSVVMDYGNYI